MSLYSAIAGDADNPGKRLVYGTVSPAAATGSFDLGAKLETVDAVIVSFREAAVTTCALVSVSSISGTTVNWDLKEPDATVATTFIDFDYIAIGKAPS
jgi:hypothetical protein